MNNKVYRLLRNNKEQGPFTADELIQKNLKPFDLVWADGRSAAWSYPTEMSEFKMYVPDVIEKVIANNLKVSTAAQISASVQAAVSVNDIIKKESPQKPRYKVSAAWSKIQTIVPVYKDVMVAEPKKISSAKIIDHPKVQPANVKSLSWEQAWLDWEQEKKGVAFPKSANAQTSKIAKQVKKEPVLEKKFEQSLDTITDNYIDSLLQQKKSKSINLGKASEFVLPSFALIIIFSIAYWFMHNTKVTAVPNRLPSNNQVIFPDKNKQQPAEIKTSSIKNLTTRLIEKPVQNASIKISNLNETAVKEQSSERDANTVKFIEPVKKDKTYNVADNNINLSKSAGITNIDLKKAGTQTTKQFDPSVINNVSKDNTHNDVSAPGNAELNAAENKPVKRRTNVGTEAGNQNSNQTVSNTSPVKNSNINSGLNYVSVPEYITMNDGSGNLKIQNTSDVDLDLAVIDVQYYDASGRFRKGETLYLHNLKAGKSVNIKTAKDADAAYATSKVSLVSSDANGVYAVGDN